MNSRQKDESFLTYEDLTEMSTVMGLGTEARDSDTVIRPPASRRRRRRRLKYAWDQILRRFQCTRNPLKSPKKEYVRCAIIRAHKKALRQLAHSFGEHLSFTEAQRSHWQAFAEVSQSVSLQEIAQTCMGPGVEGVNRPGQTSACKSFNNTFCRSYFESEEVRRSYSLFIEYSFVDREISALCEKFHIRCCSGQHGIMCSDQWDTFKQYVQVDLLHELKLVPWTS